MEITTGLLTKSGAALALLGIGGTSIYFGHDYVTNNLSRYDIALINFLDKEGGNNDIIFEVKKGEEGTEDLTANDIAFSTNPASVTAKVKVTANTTGSTFKTNSGTANEDDLKPIKELEKTSGNGWTWECSFKFEAIGTDTNNKTIKDDHKNKIWKHSDSLGLFGLLKKDLSSYTDPTPADATKWTKKEIVQTKIDFIRKCGYERGLEKNRKLNKEKVENQEIKVGDISIKFKVDGENLVPDNESTFNHWFNHDTSKTYAATSSGS